VDRAQLGKCGDSNRTAKHGTEGGLAGAEMQIGRRTCQVVSGLRVGGAVTWARLAAVNTIELKPPSGVAIAAGEKCCEVDIPTATKK